MPGEASGKIDRRGSGEFVGIGVCLAGHCRDQSGWMPVS
jgi:hypothetical protein